MAAWTSWWIQVLLRLYPGEYRAREGTELASSMAACAERERRSGRHAAVVAAALAGDAFRAAVLVRRDERRRRSDPHRHPGDSIMQSILHDLHDGLRLLRRAPVFSLVVIGTLALTIGANAAIFGVVNSVLLRAFPYRGADHLVLIYQGIPSINRPFGFSAPDFVAFRERTRSVESIAAFRSVEFELSGMDQPERIQAAKISAALFDVLGVAPALGRAFTDDEDRGRRPVAIISDGLWRRKFGATGAIVGMPILLDRRPFTIVGVTAPGFQFPERGPILNNVPADVYVPISFSDAELGAFGSMYNNSAIARLRATVTLAQAQSEATAIARQVGSEVYPAQLRELGLRITVTPRLFRDEVVGNITRILVVLMAAVAVVLVIAAADIAGLMLTRAASRERELAVRAALGAGRARLMRMMLVEASVLAAIGGTVGLILAWWGSRALLLASPIALPRAGEVSLDARAVGFTAAVTIICALICGIVPAWEASRRDTGPGLKEGGRTGSASTRQRRIFGGLVTLQFAMAIVLLASGGLLIRSVARLIATDPGIRTDGVISLGLSLPAATYSRGADVRAFYGRLLDRVRALPGVTAAGTSTSLPLSVRERRAFTIETPPAASADLPRTIAHDWVAGGYFQALGITPAAGRTLADADTLSSEPVVVLNDTMAKKFWPGESPLGRRMAWGNSRIHGPWMRIVGVVADVKLSGLAAPVEPQSWSPWQQLPDGALAENITGIFRGLRMIVRAAVPPATLVPAIRQEVRTLDPALPVTDVKTLDEVIGDSTGTERFTAALLGAFAGVALLLAAVGVAGVLAISVSRRTQEIGIRLALGARAGDVLRMVLRQGLGMAVLGLAIGLPIALAATRVLATLLFGVGTHDPLAFGGATVLLLLVALAACAAPAIRASRVDPMTALRID